MPINLWFVACFVKVIMLIEITEIAAWPEVGNTGGEFID
jgi:hypothetical protein